MVRITPPFHAPRVHAYAGGCHDRADQLRGNDTFIQSTKTAENSQFIPFWQGRPLLRNGTKTLHLARLSLSEITPHAPAERSFIFLGQDAGRAIFAVDFGESEPPPAVGETSDRFEEIRPLVLSIPPHEASLIAQARGLLHWQKMHQFCGVCGAPNRISDGGHKMVCTQTPSHLNFPRTDPAVIMLVRHEEKVLLARGTRFPPDSTVLTALAGFLEPGESAEEAVIREVQEEVGLKVTGLRYHSSQPWPFPGSLMLAFEAVCEKPDLTLDPGEISVARWMTRDQVRNFDTLGFTLPGPAAIARSLISDWLAEDGNGGI